MTVRDVVGSMNVKDTLGLDAAEHALRLLVAEGVELGGLQEWSKSRDGLFKTVGNLRHGRGDQGGGPIFWSPSRYEPVRAIKTKVLVRGGTVGRLVGRRAKLGPSYATVGVFHDELLGGHVTVINIHLTAEVQYRAGYRTDLKHAPRVRRHKAERRALGRLVRAHERRGNRVYVVGDTNYDGFDCPPLISCWDHRPGGTLGRRAVDVVLAPDKAERVQTIPTASDHDAVVAIYRRKP